MMELESLEELSEGDTIQWKVPITFPALHVCSIPIIKHLTDLTVSLLCSRDLLVAGGTVSTNVYLLLKRAVGYFWTRRMEVSNSSGSESGLRVSPNRESQSIGGDIPIYADRKT